MFKNLRIFTKVFGSHVAVGAVSVIALSLVSYFLFQRALIERTFDQLLSINALKRTRIEAYFRTTQKSMEERLAEHDILQEGSIKDRAVSSDIEKLREYYDVNAILIATINGEIVASTEHDSLLQVLSTTIPRDRNINRFSFMEANTYLPLKNTVLVYMLPVQIAAQPCYLLIEDKFEKIQNILLETTGMGNTGESYLVGRDFKMRSSSRFYPEKEPRSITVQREDIFTNDDAGEVALDYRGVKVLTVSSKVDSELDWALVTEIDFDEATQPLQQWETSMIVAAAVILFIIVVITYFIANSISKPILYLKQIIMSLSKGVIPQGKVVANGTDEVRQIAEAILELAEGLKRTAQFADETGSGNFNAPFTTLSDQDTLGQALLHMRDRLRELTNQYIQSEREKASALMEGQEKERKRIVLELHDGVGQLLTAVRLRIEGMKFDPKSVQELNALVNETIDEVKRISYNLMPNVIVDFGLEAALKGLCVNIQKSSGTPVDFQYVREFDHVLSFEISIGVFRIIQEGLNNIVKHAGATSIELHVVDNEHELYVLLRDNGRGFQESTVHTAGFGLRSMKERATLLKGKLEIHSSPDNGTELEVSIPIPQTADVS